MLYKKTGLPFSRRIFLKSTGLLTLLLGFPSLAWALLKRRFPVRTVEIEDFEFDPVSGLIKWDSGLKEPYRLEIGGLVEQPQALTYGQLRALPQIEQVSDFHCVEGWSVQDVRWGGFRFQEIADRVKPRPQARFAVFHALGRTRGQPEGQDHYLESLPLDKLISPKSECLLVLDMDGTPLSHDHGAPLRVVSPYDLAYKSIKFVTRIEITDRPAKGWWTLANPIYPMEAPVPSHRLRTK